MKALGFTILTGWNPTLPRNKAALEGVKTRVLQSFHARVRQLAGESTAKRPEVQNFYKALAQELGLALPSIAPQSQSGPSSAGGSVAVMGEMAMDVEAERSQSSASPAVGTNAPGPQ